MPQELHVDGSSEQGFFPPTGKGLFPKRCPNPRFGLELSMQTTGLKECVLVAYELCARNVLQMDDAVQHSHNPLLYTFDDPLTEAEVLTSGVYVSTRNWNWHSVLSYLSKIFHHFNSHKGFARKKSQFFNCSNNCSNTQMSFLLRSWKTFWSGIWGLHTLRW